MSLTLIKILVNILDSTLTKTNDRPVKDGFRLTKLALKHSYTS